jgi:hypothetical protein
MCFFSADDVKSFYEEYALRKGFGWRIRNQEKEKMDTTRNKAYRGGQTVAVGSEPSSPLCYPAVTVAFLQPPPLCL